MISADYVRTLFAYSAWATARLLDLPLGSTRAHTAGVVLARFLLIPLLVYV